MSRSGYTDYDDGDYPVALYRGTVASATRGKRGQRFYKDLLAALDDMPVKELHAAVFDDPEDGRVCALGALARVKGINTTKFCPEDDYAAHVLATKFDVADCLTRETIYINDEGSWTRNIRLNYGHLHGEYNATVEEPADLRWQRVRNWVAKQIASSKSDDKEGG